MTKKIDKTIRVVLIGGSGYAGFEVIRWLARHPNVELTGIFGPADETGPMDEFYPLLSKQVKLSQETFDIDKVKALDANLAMLCVPHKVAMSYVPALMEAGLRVIDWSADYRLKDAAIYEKWYCPHTDPAGLQKAIYGLPEYYADAISSATLVANPGCYPTCSVLALAPLLKDGLVEPDGIIVSAISGITGAGRKPSDANHFPQRNENYEPYAVGNHRHMPEMEQVLSELTSKPASILFQPHLCPMDRGMSADIYASPVGGVTESQLLESLQQAYASAPFVRVRTDTLPATKYVAGTNFCDLAVRLAKGKVIIFSALDNLIKGASGQAIQNMNLMFNLDETTGLY